MPIEERRGKEINRQVEQLYLKLGQVRRFLNLKQLEHQTPLLFLPVKLV